MSDAPQEERVRLTVTVSPANHLSTEDWQKWAQNLLKFTAPLLALFFGQLAVGTDYKVAGGVALLAFYAALADLFNKYKSETISK